MIRFIFYTIWIVLLLFWGHNHGWDSAFWIMIVGSLVVFGGIQGIIIIETRQQDILEEIKELKDEVRKMNDKRGEQ